MSLKPDPLNRETIESLHRGFPDWTAVADHHLHRRFRFPDFRTALAFVNLVGGFAEAMGHHPDILLSWGSVEITLWTHDIDGLSARDFDLARQIDAAFV